MHFTAAQQQQRNAEFELRFFAEVKFSSQGDLTHVKKFQNRFWLIQLYKLLYFLARL